MKYSQRFNNMQDANGFYINYTPFACTIKNGPNMYDTQNLHTNDDGKKIKVIDDVAYIVDGYKGLRFKSNGSTTISLTNNGGNAPDIKYSLDGGETWTQWNYNSISLANGQIICFKGNNPNGFSTSSSIYSKFVFGGSGTIEAYGNIMSLIDDGLCQTLTIPCSYCFYSMFSGCTSLTSAPNELPATTLAVYCYSNMFSSCTSLISAPSLPATTLANRCYSNMFSRCTSLISAPELKATTLTNYCYDSMFSSCTSLISASSVYITTTRQGCCMYMFNGCTSLTSVPTLSATQLYSQCYESMFTSCKSLTSAPVLPATTLNQRCYQNMFQYCTNLNYIKCLAISGINTSSSTYQWVQNVKSTGTFVKASSASWPSDDNGIPSGWTIQNA